MASVAFIRAALFLSLAAAFHPVPVGAAQPAGGCDQWQACRALALEARERHEFERFHDLAWRAVQTRGGRDPELMFLLARAQALSGRPHDALVMLRRLAELGEPFDAITHEDLARTRRLPGWPEARALLERAAAATTAAADPAAPAAPAGEDAPERAAEPAAPPASAPSAPAPATPAAAAAPAARTIAQFPLAPAEVGGLAYDAVSRRFIVGNAPARKLTVVGEGTNRPVTYAGEAAALYDVRALRIDRRQGDLWVVSADCPAPSACRSALHKLQLISGRVLKVFDAPRERSRFLDVAVAGGRVLVLDADGPRVLRAGADGNLEPLCTLPDGEVTSFAVTEDGRALYVAYRDRLIRVDPRTGRAARVTTSGGATVAGLERMRWHRGALVAIQADPLSSRRVVRIRLAPSGARVRALDVLSGVGGDEGRVLAMDVAGDELYYLMAPERAGGETLVRSARLR